MPAIPRSNITPIRIALLLTVIAFISIIYTVTTGPAWAGPPLICHPFAIGDQAESLPWGDGGFSTDRNFDGRKLLVPRTLALLTDEMPILVRMETLRRAALYGEKYPAAAFELLASLEARILTASLNNEAKPLAWFDAGYFAQSIHQIGLSRSAKNQNTTTTTTTTNDLTGYDWALKAIELQPKNAELAFGVALTLNLSHEHAAALGYQDQQDQCLRIALKGIERNNLLKQNIEDHFNTSVAELSKKIASKG